MPLTFGQAKDLLSKYADRGGKCPTAESVNLFVRKVLEYLLYSGEHGSERTFSFHAVQGCLTVPYELETPLKITIDGEVGTVWDRFYEYRPSRLPNECTPAQNALIENPNYVCTAYQLTKPSYIGVQATCEEDANAHLIVQGTDSTGITIYTNNKEGEQQPGEQLSIKKGKIMYSNVIFNSVDHIVKTRTKGYVILYAICPQTKTKTFLAQYSPVEEIPQYRQFRLRTRCPNFCKVSVLGRIRLKPEYLDNDVIPFESLDALDMAGQTLNSRQNKDLQAAAAENQMLEQFINKENTHKKILNGQLVEVGLSTSAGAIKNVVPGQLTRYNTRRPW